MSLLCFVIQNVFVQLGELFLCNCSATVRRGSCSDSKLPIQGLLVPLKQEQADEDLC
jgi:hypothetical protein